MKNQLKAAAKYDDHYIAQTYLSRFIDFSKPGHVQLYRKSNPMMCVPAVMDKK